MKIQVIWCYLEIRSVSPALYLWGHSMSMVHPMGPVPTIPKPSENQTALKLGQSDLIGV